MTPKVIFRFDKIPSEHGDCRIEIKRMLNAAEARHRHEDTVINCDPMLVCIEEPEVEEQLEDSTGRVLASEFTIKLIDTFQNGFLSIANPEARFGMQQITGYANTILDLGKNFSLFNLIFCDDVLAYVNHGLMKLPADIAGYAYPPDPLQGITMSLFISGQEKVRTQINLNAITYPEQFLYGYPDFGKYLTDNRDFYAYSAAEKVIEFQGIDQLKWLLERVDTSHGLIGGIGMGSTNLIEKPTTPDTNGAGSMTLSPTYAHQPGSSSPVTSLPWVFQRPDIYQYLTMWQLGGEYNTLLRDTGAAWVGIDVRTLMNTLYQKAWGKDAFGYDAQPCTWKFNPMGISSGAFVDAAPDGYRAYLKDREQTTSPTGHHSTVGFSLLPPRPYDKHVSNPALPTTQGQETVFLDASFCANIHAGDGQGSNGTGYLNDKPYSFDTYQSAWDVVTRLPASFGFYTRMSLRNGMPFVTHAMRTLTPPLLKMPAFAIGQSTCNPFATDFRTVECSPIGDWGSVTPLRRTYTGPSWSMQPPNNTCSWNKTNKLFEPQYDRTNTNNIWDSTWGYFDEYKALVLTNETSRPNLHQPLPNTVLKPEQIFKWQQCFGLFGNNPVMVFGGQGIPVPGTHMAPEFTYLPAGSRQEGELRRAVDRQTGGTQTNFAYYSANPSVLLFAGYSSDHGKTISNASGLYGTLAYYRGAGSIDVPYGTDTITCYSGLEAGAVFMAQFKCSRKETRRIGVPTTKGFENSLGETGWDACYPMVGWRGYNKTFLITRVHKKVISGFTEMDLEELPQDLPSITITNPVNGTQYSWTGSGGDSHLLGTNSVQGG
jgi:hypothetical protein